jgi:hypothetical protein
MTDDELDRNTYQWTVETVTPQELAAIKNGQTSLFDNHD